MAEHHRGRSLYWLRTLLGQPARFVSAAEAAENSGPRSMTGPPLGAVVWYEAEPYGNCALSLGDGLVLALNSRGIPRLPDGGVPAAGHLHRLDQDDRRHVMTTICRTETIPIPMGRWDTVRRERIQVWSHPGPCRVGLDLLLGQTSEHTGRWALRRAIGWAEGLDEFDDILPLAQQVVTRPSDAKGMVEMSAEERHAIQDLVGEAVSYWETCGYGTDEDEEDRMLVQLPLIGSTTCWTEFTYGYEDHEKGTT